MMQATKLHLDLGDGQLYYETAGEGMALILSHAAFLDSRMFDDVWEALAQHFHVIRYDMRGYGQSSPVNSPLSRRDDLHRLLNHLNVTHAHLVGCSNGGQISLDLARTTRANSVPDARWFYAKWLRAARNTSPLRL